MFFPRKQAQSETQTTTSKNLTRAADLIFFDDNRYDKGASKNQIDKTLVSYRVVRW